MKMRAIFMVGKFKLIYLPVCAPIFFGVEK